MTTVGGAVTEELAGGVTLGGGAAAEVVAPDEEAVLDAPPPLSAKSCGGSVGTSGGLEKSAAVTLSACKGEPSAGGARSENVGSCVVWSAPEDAESLWPKPVRFASGVAGEVWVELGTNNVGSLPTAEVGAELGGYGVQPCRLEFRGQCQRSRKDQGRNTRQWGARREKRREYRPRWSGRR